MDSTLIRGMFLDMSCMFAADPTVRNIEREVWATKRKCAWLDAVPQALEHKVRPSIGRILQYLHPRTCENIRKMGEREILLAYWRAQARSKKQLSFLEFLCEQNVAMRVDLLLA